MILANYPSQIFFYVTREGALIGWRYHGIGLFFHGMAVFALFSRYYGIWNCEGDGMAVLSIFFGCITVSVVKVDGITVSRYPIRGPHDNG